MSPSSRCTSMSSPSVKGAAPASSSSWQFTITARDPFTLLFVTRPAGRFFFTFTSLETELFLVLPAFLSKAFNFVAPFWLSPPVTSPSLSLNAFQSLCKVCSNSSLSLLMLAALIFSYSDRSPWTSCCAVTNFLCGRDLQGAVVVEESESESVVVGDWEGEYVEESESESVVVGDWEGEYVEEGVDGDGESAEAENLEISCANFDFVSNVVVSVLTFSRLLELVAVAAVDVVRAVVVEGSGDVVVGSGIFSTSLWSRRLQKVFPPWNMRPSLSMMYSRWAGLARETSIDLSISCTPIAALASVDWDWEDVTELGSTNSCVATSLIKTLSII